jgi:hypothetical protein
MKTKGTNRECICSDFHPVWRVATVAVRYFVCVTVCNIHCRSSRSFHTVLSLWHWTLTVIEFTHNFFAHMYISSWAVTIDLCLRAQSILLPLYCAVQTYYIILQIQLLGSCTTLWYLFVWICKLDLPLHFLMNIYLIEKCNLLFCHTGSLLLLHVFV